MLRISQRTEALQKQLAETQSVIVQEQVRNHSITQQLTQRVITDRTNALSAEFKSVIAYVPQRQGSKILLTAEGVHGLQNKPPEVNGSLNELQLLTFDLRRGSFANTLESSRFNCARPRITLIYVASESSMRRRSHSPALGTKR